MFDKTVFGAPLWSIDVVGDFFRVGDGLSKPQRAFYGLYVVPNYWWPDKIFLGRYITVAYTDVQCSVSQAQNAMIYDFIRAYGVVARYPVGGDAGGGGNYGPSVTCIQEEVIAEINYGDGTGWHELWRGTTTV